MPSCAHSGSSRLEEFWQRYRALEPNFEIFSHDFWEPGDLVPLYIHGDGGRTYRREELMCVQFQPILGLGTRKSHPLRVHSSKTGKAGVNMRGHSFTTRFLYGVMQKSFYKDDPHVFQLFLEKLMENFAGLYYEGFQVENRRLRFIILGLKGDLPFLSKAGNLKRTFLHIRKAPQNARSKPLRGCCWLCAAGSDQYTFEDFSSNPAWAATAGAANEVAWDACPLFLEHAPHVRCDPGSYFKLDVLHIYHLGVGRDFSGSSLVHLLKLYEASSIPNAIETMNADLKDFLRESSRQLHFKLLSRDMLGFASDQSYPTGHWSKAMDTPVMVEFAGWLLARHADAVASDRLLQIMQEGSRAIGVCMRTMLQAGLWMSLDETSLVGDSAQHFVKCYGKLATICYGRNLCLYNLTPKLHCFHHIALRLLQHSQKQLPFSMNPLAESCFSDEDFIGRISRLSRRVAPRRQSLRTIQRYLASTRQELEGS